MTDLDPDEGTLPLTFEVPLVYQRHPVIPPYPGGEQRCPKCLSTKVDAAYHVEGQSSYYATCRTIYATLGEHLCFQCEACGYGWLTAVASEADRLSAETGSRGDG